MESCVQGNNRFIEITLTDITGKTIQRKIVKKRKLETVEDKFA